MVQQQQHEYSNGGAIALAPRLEAALEQLAVARDYARDVRRDIWEFAVEMASLTGLGLSRSDLRWLVCKGYIVHAHEVTLSEDTSRSFLRGNNLAFGERTCFVLSEEGGQGPNSQQVAAAAPAVPALGPRERPEVDSEVLLLPHWDAKSRVLRIGQRIVKRFRFAASNQETVLAAFQEEGWPLSVYDPLSGSTDQDAKRRLHDTIKCLNRNQENRLIIFRGGGTGDRILWEPAQSGRAAYHARQLLRPAA